MPKKGFKNICIKESVFKKLSELAEKRKKSIAKLVTEITMAYINSLETHQGSDLHGQD